MKTTLLSLSLWALLFACSTQIFAVDFTVNQAGDAGDLTCDATCTLRDAVDDANAAASNDTITFAAGITTVTLVNSEIVITNSGTLSINGGGANVFTINGGTGANRIFSVNGATATISGVTLTGGNAGGALSSNSGGAIFATGANLTLTNVHVFDNFAFGGGGASLNSSVTVITGSTFSANRATPCAGLDSNGGTLQIVNSTFSGNISTNVGGGFCAQASNTTTLRNVTIANNSATTGGGGIYSSNSSLNFGNTIIAGNTGSATPEILRQGGGTATSAGFNLVGDAAGDSTSTGIAIGYLSSDIRDTPPLLDVLTISNGGTTPTRALLTNSPAIDQGSSFGSITDQRGLLRPVDNVNITNAAGGDGADIGAFEVQAPPTAAAVSVGGRVTVGGGRGLRNARVTIIAPNGESRTAVTGMFGYYRFENVPAGNTYVFTVAAKRYTFAQQSQIQSITEDADDINFESENF